MSHNYLPQRDSDLLPWLQNYQSKIAVDGLTLGLTAQQITDQQDFCADMQKALLAVATKKDELKSAVSAKNDAAQTKIGALRLAIANIKTLPSYTNAIGNNLGIIATNVGFDPTTYKAQITAEIFGGFVRIKFKKMGADGVNIYHRKKGTATWLFLALDTKSPYDDHITLGVPNQPEHWEYMAYGVIDDAQIGLQSDIVEVVFGG
ncbi:MAG: hypothetical protein U0T32_05205 [Chitinophagales bacterium]